MPAPSSPEGHVPATIPPKRSPHRSDAEIARRAEPQHGVLTLAQLEAVGLSRRAIGDRVASGRLHRVHRGVFGVERPTREGRWLAAVLAIGERAVLSHRSAAALWGLGRDTRSVVDVTAQDAIPCTALPRTLLDV